MPKKNKKIKKVKNSVDQLNIMQLILKTAGGAILLLIGATVITHVVRIALFKYDASSCNKGVKTKCDNLLNYTDILEDNSESITNPYFKKIYETYKSNKEYQINKMFNKMYADDCIQSMGEDIACRNIEKEFLDDDLKKLVQPFIEKHKKLIENSKFRI